MKQLSEYVNEWKLNNQSVNDIDKVSYSKFFVYKITEEKRIKIFDKRWEQLKDYKKKVYLYGKRISIDKDGYTEYHLPGIYKFEIKDINNIKNCSYMFCDCSDLIQVPLFNTSEVKNMGAMFSGCIKLIYVPLFNTKNVENMSGMFEYCSKLIDIPLFDTSNVINMNSMFKHCYNIEYVPKFNAINVQGTYKMFMGCKKLKTVELFNINQNTDIFMNDMFDYYNNLDSKTKNDWSNIYDFNNCKKRK